MNRRLNWEVCSSYAIAGVLLGVGFIWSSLWICGLIGVALFIHALCKTPTLKIMLIGSYATWTVKAMAAVFWFWSTYPIEWINVSLGGAELPVIGVYWLTVSLFLGTGGLFFGFVWWYAKKYLPLSTLALIFPLLWVIGEVVGSFGFSIGTYGEGGSVNSYFSFGYLGYLLGQHGTLLLVAKVAGVYGVTALMSLLGYGMWYVCTKLPKQKAGLVVVATLLLLWGSRGEVAPVQAVSLTEGATVVAIIDTAFGGGWHEVENKYQYKDAQVKEAVQAALSLKPGFILLPEDSRYTNAQVGVDRSYRLFRFQNSDPDVVLIDSGRTVVSEKKFAQRAYVYDGVSKDGLVTDKQYLVPQGEFMPYFYSGSLRLLGLGAVARDLQELFTYIPGPELGQQNLPQSVPGILFCFESADPRAARRLKKERTVPFIAHPISHAWFHESELLWQQQDVMLKMQALWSGVPIVSAANMAKGALYTEGGKKVLPAAKLKGESWEVSLVSW